MSISKQIDGSGYVIDFDEFPFTPPCWEYLKEDQSPHRIMGEQPLDFNRIQLLAPGREMSASTFWGILLLSSARVVPVNMLDFFLGNQELIPKEFRGLRPIFFTLYRINTGSPMPIRPTICSARCLSERFDGTWSSHFLALNSTIGPNNPAVLWRN